MEQHRQDRQRVTRGGRPVLNALTTRTSITTIVRVQGTDYEMFFLHSRSTPEQLRIEMSAALGAIRAARAAAAQESAPGRQPATPASPVAELAKLADMLAAGLITREEFEQLKARILQGWPGDMGHRSPPPTPTGSPATRRSRPQCSRRCRRAGAGDDPHVSGGQDE